MMAAWLTFAAALLAAIASVFNYLRSRKNGERIQEVRLLVNGRVDALIDNAKAVAFSEGVKAGRSAESREHDSSKGLT